MIPQKRTLLFTSDLHGGESRRVAVRLASSPQKVAVRITGGCRLEPQHINGLNTLFVDAFRGCEIALLSGGTRLINPETGAVTHSITEVVPLICAQSPQARAIAIVPRLDDLYMVDKLGLLISDEPGEPYVTIVHPLMDACLLLQYSVDRGVQTWDAEWQAALDYMSLLRTEGDYRTAHVFYNGGITTERELLHVANLPQSHRPWLVILIADSGGVTQKWANDGAFLHAHSNNVVVCTKETFSKTLLEHNITQPPD